MGDNVIQFADYTQEPEPEHETIGYYVDHVGNRVKCREYTGKAESMVACGACSGVTFYCMNGNPYCASCGRKMKGRMDLERS